MAKTDRIFQLEIVDGQLPKSSIGMTDSRLFKGGNKLHIMKDEETNFWYFVYDEGTIPSDLRCRFTNFKMALKQAEVHYKARNLSLKELDD
jgi:hypothetical protein